MKELRSVSDRQGRGPSGFKTWKEDGVAVKNICSCFPSIMGLQSISGEFTRLMFEV